MVFAFLSFFPSRFDMFVATLFFRSKAAALAQAGGEGAPAKVVRRRRAPKTPAATVNGSDIFVKACITARSRGHIGSCQEWQGGE